MNATEKFNALSGIQVSRQELEKLVKQAQRENHTATIYRISKILNKYPKNEQFNIEVMQYPTALAGVNHTGDYREALDDCGRLRKGWKFVKGSVVKVEKKETKTLQKNTNSSKKVQKIQNNTETKEQEQTGLSGVQIELSTEDFKSMTVKELRAFTLQYYLENLKGKTATIKKYLKEVVFTTKAGRKIANGEAMYSAKAVAVKHLQELIENSTYNNWGDRKSQDSPNILGYLNFKSKLVIDGEKKHIRIAIILDKDRNLELKSFDVGKKKNSQVPQGPLPSAEGTQLFESKDMKKK